MVADIDTQGVHLRAQKLHICLRACDRAATTAGSCPPHHGAMEMDPVTRMSKAALRIAARAALTAASLPILAANHPWCACDMSLRRVSCARLLVT